MKKTKECTYYIDDDVIITKLNETNNSLRIKFKILALVNLEV